MSGLAGFTDNPFRDRSDLLRAAIAIVKPLDQYRSKFKARVKIYPSTAAGFDDVASQLEGFARPLWAISALIDKDTDPSLHSWIQGIEAGVDPGNTEYWGDLGSFDQRMVEMESIAFALLMAPHAILSLLSAKSKRNLGQWLQQINRFNMPQSNWRWFRVLVNLALAKVLDADKEKARQAMDADFEVLDQFYLGEGWSSDGVWGDDRKQADYYSGSFAIQFAQLLYIRCAEDDQERVAKYVQQALEFASEYWRYFDINGAAIPFGRSMTYRFACGAFWAAFALADVESPNSPISLGTAKGLLFRHLRWWAKQPEIFNPDGTMNIGFTYPNMYMSEDYTSRQSVYWCLKSFVILGLQADHPFWTIEEEPHPISATKPLKALLSSTLLKVIAPPHHILCNTPEHHYLLSSGQMTTKKFKAREAKYGKFAYSSAFGYSVPTGLELHQVAPDSTLAMSLDGGETWKVRWQPVDVRIETLHVESLRGSDDLPVIASTWRPLKNLSLSIRTTLVPLSSHYQGWHLRVHHIKDLGTADSVPWSDSVELVDSSFAIRALTDEGHHIPSISSADDSKITEGYTVEASSVLIRSGSGASGIVDLTPLIKWKGAAHEGVPTLGGQGHLIAADPNTNLITQRTFISSIRYSHKFVAGKGSTLISKAPPSIILATGVFGVSNATTCPAEITAFWKKRPGLEVDMTSSNDIRIKIL
ncbi:hypothetical protein FIE12Z_1416 [Fusarium flagelliforme]|uniref:DUF2264 domain-containing protein n=1 Tax=Fusarium flagelliforme TaxID=2675880 RepID=A0A395N2U8_9HYPO|nr:hypothetical protein FIE12Z_1416 [Fusarium flagelliforme]